MWFTGRGVFKPSIQHSSRAAPLVYQPLSSLPTRKNNKKQIVSLRLYSINLIVLVSRQLLAVYGLEERQTKIC